jgi:C4-dicarboxylate transporter DctQ subunit
MRSLVAVCDLIVTAHGLAIRALALAAAALILAMGLWISYEVTWRYLFAAPTIWVADMSEYALVFAAFMAAPWAQRRHAHASVNILPNLLPDRPRRLLRGATLALAALVCFIFCYYAAELCLTYYNRGQLFAKAWNIPVYIPFLSLPIGLFFLGVEFVLQLAGRVQPVEAVP